MDPELPSLGNYFKAPVEQEAAKAILGDEDQSHIYSAVALSHLLRIIRSVAERRWHLLDPAGGVAIPAPGAVAHLGERLHGMQEVVGS